MTARLYDLAGAGDLRFSPYCFRAKLALAVKGVAVETIPVPFTGIRSIGHGSFRTLPVLEDSGELVGDSFSIALHLERFYPDRPALFAPGEAGQAAARLAEGFMNLVLHPKLLPAMVLDIHNSLQAVDQPYFRHSRESRLGRTLEEVQAGRAGKLEELRLLLWPLRHALTGRAFLGGEHPMFVDAAVFGSIAWSVAIGTVDLLGDDPVLVPWFWRCAAMLPKINAA